MFVSRSQKVSAPTADDHNDRMTSNERLTDPILRPLLDSKEEMELERLTERLLMDHADPIIEKILTSRFAQSSLDSYDLRADLHAEIMLRLLYRLGRLVSDPHSPGIERFDDYVAVVTFHAFDDAVRRAYPVRWRLKNRVRYALNHDHRLFCGEDSEGNLVGAIAGRERLAMGTMPQVRQILRRDPLPDLLVEILKLAGGPLPLEPLVTLVAEVRAEHDFVYTPLDHAELQQPIGGDAAHRSETLQLLQRMWSEICELPLRQRVALLLNLRDPNGEPVARFLPVTGVASIREIAGILALDDERFSALWLELPLDDNRIAELLQVTRQQVINLRKSARERLARRMKELR